MFTSVGKLMYDPHKSGIRIIKPSDHWIILKTGEGIVEYYKWWLHKLYQLKFEKTIWGSHISVNRGVRPPNKNLWGKYEGEQIEFTYTNRIYRANEIFFCVDAYSKRLEEIRLELGLSAQPNYGFHLTVARLNKLQSLERAKAICPENLEK
jgi:hypothetical protein